MDNSRIIRYPSFTKANQKVLKLRGEQRETEIKFKIFIVDLLTNTWRQSEFIQVFFYRKLQAP
jgi:hypothetical protein